MSLQENKIGVIWEAPSIGPYHDARYRALAALNRVDLKVVEVASMQEKYPWKASEQSTYERTVLFDTSVLEEIPEFKVLIRIGREIWKSRSRVVVLVGYTPPREIIAAVFAKLLGRKVLTIFDSTELDHERNQFKETLKGVGVRWLYDGVFCSGSRSREYLKGLGFPDARIQEGLDVVDNSHFAAPRERTLSWLPEGRFFLSVSRFAKEKNLFGLLEAYERYCSKTTLLGLENDGCCGYPERQGMDQRQMDQRQHESEDVRKPWPLVMCGTGPLDQAIRRRAASISNGAVVFPGFVAYDVLPEVYQRSGCMVLPSLSEPWGLVVNEALAACAPVIVSERCGCAADLVRHGSNGFVFDPMNVGDLADLLSQMASMSEERRDNMGCKGREIIARYTPETWAMNFVELCERVGSNFVAGKEEERGG